MNDRARASLIDEVDTEAFAGRKVNAWTPIGTNKPEDIGRPAAYLEHARPGDKALWQSGDRACRAWQDGQDANCQRSAEKTTARVRLAHGCLALVIVA
jgi:hypothetical protein